MTTENKTPETLDLETFSDVTREHAIDLPEIDGVPNMTDYIKAISSVVGASKIVSAYRKDGKVRVYLRYLSCVEEVIRTGVRVKGVLTNADYCVPSATKVLLCNVDSEICNSVIEAELSQYGSLLSEIFKMKSGLSDPEYSHIESNIRQVHIRLNSQVSIPKYLNVSQNGRNYKITVKMEKAEEHPVVTKQENVKNGSISDKRNERYNESARPGESVVEVTNAVRPIRPRGKRCAQKNVATQSSCKIRILDCNSRERLTRGNMARRANYHNFNSTRISNKNSDSDASDSIDTNYHLYSSTIDKCDSDNRRNSSNKSSNDIFEPCTSTNSQHQSVASRIMSEDESTNQEFPAEEIRNSAPYPFSWENLELCLESIKNDPYPLNKALKMLENNKTPGAVEELCEQIIDFSKDPGSSISKATCEQLVIALTGGPHKVP